MLLQSEYPKMPELSEKLQTQVKDAEQVFGCVLVRLENGLTVDDINMPVILCGWKGKNSIRLYISKFDRRHFLHILDAPVPAEIDLKQSINRQSKDESKKEENKVDGEPAIKVTKVEENKA